MQRKILAIAIALGALQCTAAMAFSFDPHPPIYLGAGGAYDSTMHARAGEVCDIAFNPLSPKTQFDSIDVVLPPKSGTIRKSAPLNIEYVAPTGVSQDEFTLKVCGKDTRGTGCNVVKYKVSVKH